MSMKKTLNFVLFSMSMINATSHAADAGNLYTSSANAKLKWNIQQQSIEYGEGVTLNVPALNIEMLVPIAYSNPNSTCFALSKADQYNFHLNSLPQVFNDLTGNRFASWSAVQSDVSLSFEPVRDNSVSTNLPAACTNGILDNTSFKTDHVDITKNSQPFINAKNIEIKRAYQVVDNKVNFDIDISAQQIDVTDINKSAGPITLSIRLDNLDREAASQLYNPNTNDVLAASIMKVPGLITDNSRISWTFDMDSESGHTKQSGNLDLTKLFDSSLNYPSIGKLTLNALYNSSSIQDSLMAMLPKAEGLNGEINTQTTQDVINDVIRIALKSSSSCHLDNQMFGLKHAAPQDVNSLTHNLSSVIARDAAVESDTGIVNFAYKFQDGKVVNESLKK